MWAFDLFGGGVALAAVEPLAEVDIQISPIDELRSREFLTEFGVSAETQDELMDAARRGDFGMAEDPRAVPVSVEQRVVRGSDREVLRYSDGSVSVLETQRPTVLQSGLGISPAAVTGCTVRSGTGYTNYTGCKVHYRSHIFSFGFYANFSTHPGINNDQISSARSQFQDYAIGHSRASWSLRIIKQRETLAGPAHALLAIEYNILPNLGQVTKKTRLKVGSNTYWQENV